MGSSDPRRYSRVLPADPSSWTAPHRSVGLFVLLAGFWLCVGAAAGAADYGAARLAGQATSLGASLLSPMLAGAWWIPITLAASVLATRFPPRLDNARGLAVHALAALAVSFLLNAAWALTLIPLGRMSWSQLPTFAAAAGLRWMHVNAAAYLVIVGLVTLAATRASIRASTHAARRGSVAATEAAPGGSAQSDAVAPPGRIRALDRKGSRFVDVAAIDWIEGAGDYARIHTSGEELLAAQRLKSLAERLAPHGFVRVHRSAIVNAGRVERIRHLSHGDYEAALRDGARVRISRRRRAELKRVLDLQDGRT